MERLRITSAGLVGIGTTSPSYTLDVAGNCRIGAADTSAANLEVGAGATGDRSALIDLTGDTTYSDFGLRLIRNGGANANSELRHRGTGNLILSSFDSGVVQFNTAATERARIDSSGRLLVGTSSARTGFGYTPQFQIFGSTAGTASFLLAGVNTGAIPTFVRYGIDETTIVAANDVIFQLRAYGFDGSSPIRAAAIEAAVDGTPGTDDMPGRLVFSVTADGSASPTEALRISSNRAITVSDGGNVVLGTTTGTKIGTATTQKLGFYNATPVVQPTAVADATDAATVITQLNALLSRMRTLGLIAT
jgi:hypothetical protein